MRKIAEIFWFLISPFACGLLILLAILCILDRRLKEWRKKVA